MQIACMTRGSEKERRSFAAPNSGSVFTRIASASTTRLSSLSSLHGICTRSDVGAPEELPLPETAYTGGVDDVRGAGCARCDETRAGVTELRAEARVLDAQCQARKRAARDAGGPPGESSGGAQAASRVVLYSPGRLRHASPGARSDPGAPPEARIEFRRRYARRIEAVLVEKRHVEAGLFARSAARPAGGHAECGGADLCAITRVNQPDDDVVAWRPCHAAGDGCSPMKQTRHEAKRVPRFCCGFRASVAGPEVVTNTKIGGVPPPREDDPDLGDGGKILASKVAKLLPPTPKSRIIFPLRRQPPVLVLVPISRPPILGPPQGSPILKEGWFFRNDPRVHDPLPSGPVFFMPRLHLARRGVVWRRPRARPGAAAREG
ncbi:unnamed protein product [Prorocentrum cordatum]|uniref:Uncharacterized protein n=1 Tax=Prorocentrum cordatum TaxID=2364126 RepID=A0ABN9YEK1_9DINO|nr:unnamed protein product [Polarella glacialis]